MKPTKGNSPADFDRLLRSLGDPITPVEQIEESAERLLNVLEVECAIPVSVRPDNNPIRWRPVDKLWTVAILATAVLILGVALHKMVPFFSKTAPVGRVAKAVHGTSVVGGSKAEREVMPGDLIQPGQRIRTSEKSGAVVELSDGSHLELSSGVELAVDRTPDGLRIDLKNGAVIVTAAKQHKGHLYVRTKDCIVSVVGTVFAVNAELLGSRVSVLEGEVHVQYGQVSDVVRPGKQVRTNPAMVEVPLVKEIEWSQDVAALMAMLAQLPVVSPAGVPDSKPTTGSIFGTVVETATNTAISGVTVEWIASPCDSLSGTSKSRSVSTGVDGKFKFQNLDFGTYCLIPIHPGGLYVSPHYLRRGWNGRGITVSLTDSQSIESLRFEMEPTGSISGHVIDDAGEPAAYARVRAFAKNFRNGERQLIMLASVYADDRGEYRLPWLPSGRYYISAIAGDPRAASISVSHGLPGRTEGFEFVSSPLIIRQNMEDGPPIEETSVPVWYGGTVDRNYALSVEVAPGRTSNSIDIALGLGRTRALHVRGTVINGETGLPLSGAQIRIMPREWVADPIVPTAISNSKGVYDVSGVAPGSYLIYALGAPPQDKSLLSAFAELNVAGNIDGFIIKAIPSFDIEGRVVVEGGLGANSTFVFGGSRGQPDAAGTTRVALNFHIHRDPDLAGSPTALVGFDGVSRFGDAFVNSSPTTNVGSDGKFTIRNIGPGNYHVYMVPTGTSSQDYTAYSFVPTLPNAYVKSFRIGTRDLLSNSLLMLEKPAEPIELVIGTDVGEIDGKVLSDKLVVDKDVTVVLVPNQGRQRIDRYKIARTNTAGYFHMQGIAPGDYKLFAWKDVELGAWLDPDFITAGERDSHVKPVRIDGASRKSIDLTVIQGK